MRNRPFLMAGWALFFGVTAAFGVTTTWNGSTGNWNQAASWVGGPRNGSSLAFR